MTEQLASFRKQVDAAADDVALARRRGESLTLMMHMDREGNVLPCKVTRVLQAEEKLTRERVST